MTDNSSTRSHSNGNFRRSENFNILVWNVQGAGNRHFMHILREHIRTHNPSIMALVETRISGTRAQVICNKTGFRKWFRVEAQGFQGGIWVFWQEEEIDLEVINSHEQFVTVGIRTQGRLGWFVTFVYASPHSHIREVLWQQLHSFAVDYRKPWLLAGDFNETVSLEERNHGGPICGGGVIVSKTGLTTMGSLT